MFNYEQMLMPVWDTDTVYGESLTMIEKKNGECRAPLMYEPLEILEVCDATLENRYAEDVDWKIDGNTLIRLPGSRMPYLKAEEVFADKPFEWGSFPTADGHIKFAEGNFFHTHQICVTYRCARGEWRGAVPEYAGDKLPNTFKRLKDGKGLKIVAFGDSITHGSNSSHLTCTAPYQQPYFELFAEGLSRQFKNASVRSVNNAIGGMDINWGLKYVRELVIDYRPDLVLLAFGMNDGGKSVDEFREKTEALIKEARRVLPEVEFLLVATSTPNPLLTDERAHFYGNQRRFKPELDKLAAAMPGIAVADITGMQQELHSRKRFIDTTGNNVNHPNDFFHRLYAQYLLGMFRE